MDLAIDFECPDCRTTLSRKLADLAPGHPRECPQCGSSVILTEAALRTLERRLEEYCRPPETLSRPLRPSDRPIPAAMQPS